MSTNLQHMEYAVVVEIQAAMEQTEEVLAIVVVIIENLKGNATTVEG